MSEKKYYVYVHKYASGPKEGQVFYVGKGSGNRYKESRSRNRWWNFIYKKYGFKSEIKFYFKSEVCAYSFEIILVSIYGRDNLCNLTDGGGGTKSFIPHWRTKVYSSLGEEFDSMFHACIFLKENGYINARSSAISSSCDNDKKFAYGRAWSKICFPSHRNVTSQKEVAADNFRKSLSKPVYSDVYGKFDSIMDAKRYLNENGFPKAKTGNISSVCLGKRKIAYGSRWSHI